MLVTLVVRLVPEGLATGQFLGHVEHVASGEHELVRGLPDLLGFAQRAAAADLDGRSQTNAEETG
jgi:hypothetical protein